MNLFHEAKKVLDKDGKVNPLGPYGKQKLTGREISTYFRRNKVKDAKIRKAVEVALDLGGADTIARQEIKKFYGDKVLKSKEVQQALQYANEEVVKEDTDLSEDYRKLAKYGMGTETSKSAKVGLELDFYDSKGNKKFGKILQKTNTGYLVKDDKGKKHVLKYLDRKKAKDMLKPNYIHTEDAVNEGVMFREYEPGEYRNGEEKMFVDIIKKNGGKNISVEKPTRREPNLSIDFKGGNLKKMQKDLDRIDDGLTSLEESDAEKKAELSLKHTREKEALAKKHEREKEAMSESDMQNVDKAPKNKWKALGFSQHPHKGFEDERLPQDMRDFRKQAKTPSQMRVEDAYRAMWEDGEKYAPKQELGEQDLHEEVANITVDPKNRINSGQQQAYHGMEIAKQARRMGLKSAVMHKHVRIKGAKKAVNDFLRVVIGKSRYGDPTEKDMSTPQVDKMLTKGLK